MKATNITRGRGKNLRTFQQTTTLEGDAVRQVVNGEKGSRSQAIGKTRRNTNKGQKKNAINIGETTPAGRGPGK